MLVKTYGLFSSQDDGRKRVSDSDRDSEQSLTGVECCFEGLDISGHP